MNILFICSRNKKRSLTAEAIFSKHPVHKAFSAGTEENARQRVSEKMISKSDIIFVMENVHRDKLRHRFVHLVDDKPIVVLNIPDEYEYMDEELIVMLKDMVEVYL